MVAACRSGDLPGRKRSLIELLENPISSFDARARSNTWPWGANT
jgi:hypothetical protein